MSIDPAKESTLRKIRESILNLAQNGDTYRALENCQVYYRHMKKLNQIQDALIFTMHVALIFLKKGDLHASAVCAYQSILQFPPESKTIRSVLKDLFFEYAEKATSETFCPELFHFYNRLSSFFVNKREELFLRAAFNAENSKNYYYAQTFYYDILTDYSNKLHLHENEEECKEKIDKLISSLGALIWRWIQDSEMEDETQQINISQYLFARCALMILSSEYNNVELAQKFVAIFKSSVPENFADPEVIFNLPLFHFVDFFIKAIDMKSKKTADFLIKKYDPALTIASDILEYANRAKESFNAIDSSGLSGLGSIIQNFFGRMASNS